MNPAERFQQFYQTELHPYLGELEAKRKQLVARGTSMALITGAISLAAGVAVALLAPQAAMGIVPVFAGAVIAFILFARIAKGYGAEFKQNVIGRIVKFIDPGLSYDSDRSIPESVYMASQLFPAHPDRYRGEDMVWGRVGQTAIQFSEVHTEERIERRERDGKREVDWQTIFRGILFVADFNKHFQGVTVVLPDMAEKLFGRLGQKLQSLNPGRAKLVQLEDVAFEKRFVVYADDQVEARYLLSPSLMARIESYAQRTGRSLYISFVNAHVCLAISYEKNLFEPRLFKPVQDIAMVQEYLDDLMLAVSLVEELNLNTRIWTKQ